MKKLLTLLLLLVTVICYSQNTGGVFVAGKQQGFNKMLAATGAKTLDGKSKYTDTVNFTSRAFTSVAEANSYLPTLQRCVGQLMYVNSGGSLSAGVITGGTNSWYYYKDGIADGNLVALISGASFYDSVLMKSVYSARQDSIALAALANAIPNLAQVLTSGSSIGSSTKTIKGNGSNDLLYDSLHNLEARYMNRVKLYADGGQASLILLPTTVQLKGGDSVYIENPTGVFSVRPPTTLYGSLKLFGLGAAQTDTVVNMPLGINTSTGAIVRMNRWPGGTGVSGGIDSTFSKLGWLDAAAYGALADGQNDTDGVIHAGSDTLRSAAAFFYATDTGKIINIGAVGLDSSEFKRKIYRYIDAHTIRIDTVATLTTLKTNFQYGTNNAVPLQNAINAAQALSKNLYLHSGAPNYPTGRYYIRNAPITDVGGYNPDGYLFIPVAPYIPSSTQPTMTMTGDIPPSPYIDFAPGQLPPNTGVIIESLRSDSGAAILSSVASTGIYGLFNWTFVGLDKLVLRVKSNNNYKDTKVTTTGLNFANQNYCSLRDFRSEISSAISPLGVKPDTCAIGIDLPTINNGGNNFLENVIVQGFHRGIRANENTTSNNITIAGCYVGLELDSSYHDTHWQKTLMVWNVYDIRTNGPSIFKMDNLDFEVYNHGDGAWFTHVLNLDEANTTNAIGEISFFIQEAYSGNITKYFSRNGDQYTSGITIIPIGFGMRYFSPGGNDAQYVIGGGQAMNQVGRLGNLNVMLSGSPGKQVSTSWGRGATKVVTELIGNLTVGSYDFAHYNHVTGRIDWYIGEDGKIAFGGGQATLNPQFYLTQVDSSAHVTGALSTNSDAIVLNKTSGFPNIDFYNPAGAAHQKRTNLTVPGITGELRPMDDGGGACGDDRRRRFRRQLLRRRQRRRPGLRSLRFRFPPRCRTALRRHRAHRPAAGRRLPAPRAAPLLLRACAPVRRDR